ncbi:MAG: ParB/RepB/Spo0J family partition protein [Planctomyces sp.]|nr:ParB/RepB/Spo0J family partition protein [Planctomyces sp.]
MKNTDTTTSTTQLIAVSRLEKSPFNARRTGAADAIGELKASILAHGLMQNLVVTDEGDGRFRVIAGGRRLAAIHALQAEGQLADDFAVPCQVVTQEHAAELSLAENTVRLAMHPADQFEAFAELIAKGSAACDVARRFGVDESLVLKRMKLALVAPELLQLYRDGGMTLECLMAFTVTDDHRRQLKVFKSLQNWQQEDPAIIRSALTEKLIDADTKLARFVGIDAYAAAGGTSRMDLFSDEVYLEKPAILNRLARQKLDGIRRELEAEGWSWIEINPDRDHTLVSRCSRLQPRLIDAPGEVIDVKAQLDAELESVEKALDDTESDALIEQQQALRERLDEVEQTLAAHVGFDPDHKALAGCFVSIGNDGTPFIDKGLVRPEHRRQLARLLGPDAEGGTGARVKPKGQLPQTLLRELAADRLHVAQVEIARHPQIAFDLLVFHAASCLLSKHTPGDGTDVQFRRPRLNRQGDKEPTAAALAFAAMAKELPVAWLKLPSEAARFEEFRLLPEGAKLDLLAYCVASTLKPKVAASAGDEITAFDTALSLTQADVASHWRPTRDNYLGRITRDQLLAVGRDVFDEHWFTGHANHKKSALAEQLARAFAKPEKSCRLPDQVENLKRWIPACMSFALPARAKPAKTKRARKAA